MPKSFKKVILEFLSDELLTGKAHELTGIQPLDHPVLSLLDAVVADLLPLVEVVLPPRHDLPLLGRHVRAVGQELRPLRGIVARDAKEIGEFVAFGQLVFLSVLLDEVPADGRPRRAVVVVRSGLVVENFVFFGPDGLRPNISVLQFPADVPDVLGVDDLPSGVGLVRLDDRLRVDGRRRRLVASLLPTLASLENFLERLFSSKDSLDSSPGQEPEILSHLGLDDAL